MIAMLRRWWRRLFLGPLHEQRYSPKRWGDGVTQRCYVNVRLSIIPDFKCGPLELTVETQVIALGVDQIKAGCRQAFENALARLEPALGLPVVSRVKGETSI